ARTAALAKARAAAAQKVARDKARTSAVAAAQADPRSAARAMLADHGWGESQWRCLNLLWEGESAWKHTAENSSSGAYGIPQSLPASKMAKFGADYRTNPITQITWGLWYIEQSYGSPCGAWEFWNDRYPHWY
ncbi:transglycosylase SLT domain-containing protein, partial [Knoellia aerolata]